MASRTPVPALPKSSGASGSRRPRRPRPSTIQARSLSGPSRSIRAPRARIASMVDRTSADSSSPVTRERPDATAPSMSARCEMDLSPGTRTSP